MTNTRELEVAIVRANVTKGALAKALGLSGMGLYKKVNNLSEFKASEIARASKVLNLSQSEMNTIFFTEKCD